MIVEGFNVYYLLCYYLYLIILIFFWEDLNICDFFEFVYVFKKKLCNKCFLFDIFLLYFNVFLIVMVENILIKKIYMKFFISDR